ncbi:MAG: LptF/LptG family permease [Prevotellaceae bacterium]|nr:LptF/LptG family permease [Prevotellaceae bacterium]
MIRIKKLDIFIAKQFGILFVGTFFICQFVLMMQFLWRYVDELIGKGLSLEVLAQFFWYMGLMLMPQAFPLAILLSSLITFGNLGESSELTAIKAAGISLLQAFRSLIVIVITICFCSFYFQNVIGPEAHKSFAQLLLSMKQKSPELEIPEGVFYDGIPNCNLYVQKKDLNTGKLYGIMIYRMNGGYEDAAIILADSGMLQSTAEKKHLLLTLYSGEWFENMKSQDLAGSASVPYRRETFSSKRIVLDFDGGFNLADVTGIASDARSKSMAKIRHDLDSIREFNDSVGRSYYREAKQNLFSASGLTKDDSVKAAKAVLKLDIDSLYYSHKAEDKQAITRNALSRVEMNTSEINMKGDYSYAINRQERLHQIEAYEKVTLSLLCIVFFFIGAPLGAIIRKGGLGVPVIVSVLVFIVYYIFNFSGMRMARDDNWTVLFGKWISMAVLTPLAMFFTYKANSDSVVFNIDIYKNLLMSMLGIRMKRHVFKKEVIINDPDYAVDVEKLNRISDDITEYSRRHSLLKAPNPIKVFFREGDDRSIRDINQELEEVIDDLSNTKDKTVLACLNRYPVIATHAHTRPFRRRWLNALTGIILPLGLFFYLRMWRFRLRLLRDLRVIKATNADICKRVEEMTVAKEDVDKKEKDEVDNNFEPEVNSEAEMNAEAEMNFEPEVNAEAEETIEKSDKEQEKE